MDGVCVGWDIDVGDFGGEMLGLGGCLVGCVCYMV